MSNQKTMTQSRRCPGQAALESVGMNSHRHLSSECLGEFHALLGNRYSVNDGKNKAKT